MKRYYLYVVMLIITLLGTNLTDFTLSVWVLDQPDAFISSYTLIWFFKATPAVLLSVFIGSFVDRWDKKKMIIYGQLAAGIGSIVLLTLYWQGLLLPWHIMLVAGVGSVANMFVFKSFFVATKVLVATKDLVRAQALLTMSYGAIGLGAPILAPILYKWIGLINIFLLDVLSFSISIVGFILLGSIVVKKTNDPFNIRKDLRVVKAFIFNHTGFLYLLPFFFVTQFLFSLIAVLFTPLILDFSDEYTLGLILSCLGAGGILGGSIMSVNKASKLTKPIHKVILIYVIIGFLIMSLVFSVNPYFIGICCVLMSLLLSVKGPLYDSLVLTIIPEDLLGRFSGVVGLFVGIGAPIAFLFSGFLVDILSKLFKDSIYLSLYPGSVITFSIVVVFAIVGLLFSILSISFFRLKGVRVLDEIYAKELGKNIVTVKK